MSNRLQHYLTALVNNPGKYVRINKLKGQSPKADNSKERRELMAQIETALKMMGISYTRVTDRYKIKVNEEENPIPPLDPLSQKMSQKYGLALKKPVGIILDDML